MEEWEYWLGFSNFPGIGPLRFTSLLKRFGSAEHIWHAKKENLIGFGLGEKLIDKFDHFRKTFSIPLYLKKLKEKNVTYLTLLDKNYPLLLREIKNPPFVIYMKGSYDFTIHTRYIGVVGTRKITQYGREVTQSLTEVLVAQGFVIVSGLAFGVDATAHKTAIENNGKTIAVLGCGVDCCTPSENLGLYKSILEHDGCIISEFPLGQSPTRGSFPSRNRIIAGLSKAILVTEGAQDSGALITADYAFTFNRTVFAVPGPITSQLSKGPHSLFKKGAKMVTSAEDILREFKMQNAKVKSISQKSKVKDATKEEQKILALLENESLHFDEIVRRSGFPSAKVGGILSVLEVKGMILNRDGVFRIV